MQTAVLAQPEIQTELQDSAATRTFNAPRDLFDALGVDESYFRSFVDGEAIGPGDREALLRVLLRLPDFPLSKIEKWARKEVGMQQLLAQPDEHRAEIFRLGGRVVRVTAEEPLPEVAERFEISRYYRCDINLGEQQNAVVYARDVPASWRLDEPVEYQSSVHGFFLKLGEPATSGQTPVYAARRIAWHPQTELGQLGMDYGLFDQVENRKPLLASEAECFYQMLAAVGRIERLHKPQNDDSGESLIPLLTDADKHHGELFYVRGTARRAIKIRINDEDLVERFGFDHYYEVDVFVDVGRVVAIGDKKLRTYPFTVCVRRLPDNLAEGENISQQVVVPAFFMKLWTYRSKFLNEHHGQPTPLLIGGEPRVVAVETIERTSQLGLVVGSVVLAAIACLWIGIWATSRRHKPAVASQDAVLRDFSAIDSLNVEPSGDPQAPQR